MQRFLGPLFSSPLIRRVGWHLSRVRGAVDRRFFIQLLGGAFVLVLIAAAVITVVEKSLTFASLGASVNWGIQTILGQGDSSYVTSPIGWVVGWFFSLFGVAIIGTLTGALVALVIDFLLKASSFRARSVPAPDGWLSAPRRRTSIPDGINRRSGEHGGVAESLRTISKSTPVTLVRAALILHGIIPATGAAEERARSDPSGAGAEGRTPRCRARPTPESGPSHARGAP